MKVIVEKKKKKNWLRQRHRAKQEPIGKFTSLSGPPYQAEAHLVKRCRITIVPRIVFLSSKKWKQHILCLGSTQLLTLVRFNLTTVNLIPPGFSHVDKSTISKIFFFKLFHRFNSSPPYISPLFVTPQLNHTKTLISQTFSQTQNG